MTNNIQQEIAGNINKIQQKISESTRRFGRDNDSVTLLAVSKTKPPEAIMAAYQVGQRQFGENYLQEAVGKIQTLPDDINWHFIGSIQSRKIKQIIQHFNWIHTIDRLKIVEKLINAVQNETLSQPINICLQINIDNESSKSGFVVERDQQAFEQSIELLNKTPGVKLRGLMCIPDPQANKQGASFERLQQLLAQLNEQYQLQMDTLSMGMSSDMEWAIAYGSTMVRIGTAIFGQREY